MSDLIDREAVRLAKVPYDEQLSMYERGWNDACDAIADNAPTATRWVRCEDRLPEKVGSYLVYAPTYHGGSSSGKECKAGVMFAKWLKGGHWSIEVGYYRRPNCVLHWMPIEPPREDV